MDWNIKFEKKWKIHTNLWNFFGSGLNEENALQVYQ